MPSSSPCIILMSFLICEKHNKHEKTGSRTVTNALLCLDRTCPQSFKVLCSVCQPQHQKHANQLLSIEDASFLIQRLLKVTVKDVGRAMAETIDVLRKLRMIKQFRRRIDQLEKDIQAESMKLVEQTEILAQEFSQGRQSAIKLAQLFQDIQNLDTYNTFLSSSVELLGCLDYNPKKDKFQYGSGRIKQTEEMRGLYVENTKQKLLEVRDYSMKIIEVTLGGEDSQEEEVEYKMRQFWQMKEELCKDQEGEQEYVALDMKESTSTANKSQMRWESVEGFGQTEIDVFTYQEVKELIDRKTEETKGGKHQDEILQHRLEPFQKERQELASQLATLQEKYNQKSKLTNHLAGQLFQNRQKRQQETTLKDSIANKIIEYCQHQNIQEPQ